MMKARMPSAISKAPNAATMKYGCRAGLSKWLRRRVTPMKPMMYNGVNATQKPTSQNQKLALPQDSSSLKPNALGNQKLTAANTPNTTPPMITLWKCAIRNRLLCSMKSAGATDSITPVMPPMVKVNRKPIVHSIGTVKCTRPRNMVNSQLKIFTPVGMEIIMVVSEKNELTSAPEPIVKKWCSQTRYDRIMIATVA